MTTPDTAHRIASRENTLYKDLRRLAQGPAAYRKQGRVWLEGDHLCRAALARGLRPVVALYSTFLQRGYDQLIHDVALQNLPMVFALDRAGIVGADGATHAGA